MPDGAVYYPDRKAAKATGAATVACRPPGLPHRLDRVVEVITVDPNASRCPDCGMPSDSVKERTVISPGMSGTEMTQSCCGHSTVQYRVLRLFRRAGVTTHPGALVHGLRHTFANYLANANASVY